MTSSLLLLVSLVFFLASTGLAQQQQQQQLVFTLKNNPEMVGLGLWSLLPSGSSAFDTETIISCGQPGDIFTPTNITVLPDPPQKGQKVSLILKGILSEDVVQGTTAFVRVKLGLIKLFESQLDLCNEIKNVGHECPLPKGEFIFNHEIDIPGALPPGKYSVHVTATTPNNQPVACFDVALKFSL